MREFKFENNGSVNLVCNGQAVLCNIKPWFNPKLKPDKETSFEDRIEAESFNVSETSVTFAFPENVGELTLDVRGENGCFALFAKGEYDARNNGFAHGTHLDPLRGLGFDFNFPHEGNYIDAYMRCEHWQRPYIGEKESELKPRTQGLFFKQSDRFVYLSATCDKDYKTEIFPSDNGVSLRAQSNTKIDTVDECVLVGGVGDSVYTLGETVASYGFSAMGKNGKLRKDKEYPEVFEYLGWCSWDAFQMYVTHENLTDKAQEFKEKDIPVKWFILDDMWGYVKQNTMETMYSRELESWEADPARFPKGLKGIISELKEKYNLNVGIWHPTTGYWNGLDPRGEIAQKYGDLLEYTIPGLNPDRSRLMHSFDRDKIKKYYDIQHNFYSRCGADFTKVDNQGTAQRLCYLKGTLGECVKNMHEAIEESAQKYYGGALINCMGMPIENFWNRGYSNVNRFSGDFQPENREWFVQHLLQCSYNSLTQGAVYTGDWDMWWSDDGQAVKNAVLRSMSGGPIYMSDKLGRSIKEVIMPTVLSNGRIIRLGEPARPTEDCLFEDAEKSGKTYKVFNRIGEHGVVASFDLDENDGCVTGTVQAKDAFLTGKEYFAYDWFGKSGEKIGEDGCVNVKLGNRDGFTLHILCPVKDGKAVIGLTEKYMTAGAVKKTDKGYEALDDGTFAVYSEKALDGFEHTGNGIYLKKVKQGETVSF